MERAEKPALKPQRKARKRLNSSGREEQKGCLRGSHQSAHVPTLLDMILSVKTSTPVGTRTSTYADFVAGTYVCPKYTCRETDRYAQKRQTERDRGDEEYVARAAVSEEFHLVCPLRTPQSSYQNIRSHALFSIGQLFSLTRASPCFRKQVLATEANVSRHPLSQGRLPGGCVSRTQEQTRELCPNPPLPTGFDCHNSRTKAPIRAFARTLSRWSQTEP